MDAAGKDGTIKHVMSGVNPQGCQVFSFKVPSTEELDHDFLWRSFKCLPERGRIGFSTVLITKKFWSCESIPSSWSTRSSPHSRQQGHLVRTIRGYRLTGAIPVAQWGADPKVLPECLKERTKTAVVEPLEEPDKNWKFASADLEERKHWRDYQKAYEDMIRHTATEESPWYIIPADHKWFTRLAVAEAIVDTLESLRLSFPEVDRAKKKELAKIRKDLENHQTE